MTSPLFEAAARTLARSESVGSFSDYDTILAALVKRYRTDDELRGFLLMLMQQLPDEWRDGLNDEQMLEVFLASGSLPQ